MIDPRRASSESRPFFLDWLAGLDKDSAEPRRIEATAAAVVRMESAKADTFLINRMWRSLKLRHPFLLDRNRGQESVQTHGYVLPCFCDRGVVAHATGGLY